MFLSLNWLREYVDLPESAEVVGDHLTLLGFEVEGIQHTGVSLPGVVIGRVMDVKQHPNADRLRVCQVDLGTGAPVQIVCGAPNVAAGQTVAVATVGTTLPAIKLPDGKPLVIKASPIRGELSNGMICAEDELGLGTDHSGIMILEDGLAPGSPFDARFEKSRDAIIEISITPNRPDVTNHFGAARELAAKLERPLRRPAYEAKAGAATHPGFSVTIEDAAACHRYQGILIRDVQIGPSPDWLKTRIEAAGMRPVNNVVDATNYVMLAVGQPLHAFDFDRLSGGAIVVRSFDRELSFETLDHTTRTIPAGSLFICDAEKPVALAGIMGGLHSEVTGTTTTVLLESAYFNPVTIRRTARLTSLRSDASYRFERGIDPENTFNAGWLCARLIAEVAGGRIDGPSVDAIATSFARMQVSWRPSAVNRILGTGFPAETCAAILNRLELPTSGSGDHYVTEIPGFRPDLDREIDLIEEIARVYDYNRIPAPVRVGFKKPDPIPEEIRFLTALKDAAVRMGLHEIYTNSLHPDRETEGLDLDNAVRPLNPITRDQAVLRTSLLPGQLNIAAYNENRGVPGLAVFEAGRVFRKDSKGRYVEGIHENLQFGLMLAGRRTAASWQQKEANWTIFDAKALVLHLLEQLEISNQVQLMVSGSQGIELKARNTVFGRISTIGPKTLKQYGLTLPVFQAEMDAEVLCALWTNRKAKRFVPLPKFPGIEFDLAFTLPIAAPAEGIMSMIRKKGGALVQSVGVFDVFTGSALGEDRKSLAYRIQFLDASKTLTLNDIQPIIDEIVKEAASRMGAELRR